MTPSLRLENVSLVGNPINRRPFLFGDFGVGRFELSDVTVDQTTNLVQTSATNQQIELVGVTVRDFTTLLSVGNDEIIDIPDSRFERGTSLLDGNLGRSTLTRVRTVAVSAPIRDTGFGGTVGLDVTSSSFEGANVVFDFNQSVVRSGPVRLDLTGINFINTSGRVLRFTGAQANSLTTTMDLSGCFFGSGDRASVVALIEDAIRTDRPANANDDNIGRTSFVGFLSTPLLLVLP